jgi:hypothetical protein
MSTTQLRIAGAGLFFILIFLFGFWLSRSGKPYNLAIFTIHKLVTLGAIVFFTMTIYKIQHVTPLNATQISLIAVMAVCFVATIASGGLLSVEKTMPLIVRRLHQVMPYLTLLSTSATLYLLLA